MKLIEHFKEYELAMTEIHQYYDLPLKSYSYTDDMLILKIPIYVKTVPTDIGIVYYTNISSAVSSKHKVYRWKPCLYVVKTRPWYVSYQ